MHCIHTGDAKYEKQVCEKKILHSELFSEKALCFIFVDSRNIWHYNWGVVPT